MEQELMEQELMDMLQVKNLTIIHKKDLRPLMEQVSFTLQDGDKMAIIGEEGNGKSTLLKCIYDQALIEDYAEISGEILWGNHVPGYLPQELSLEEKSLSVWEYMQREPAFYEMSPKEQNQLAGELGISPEIFYEMRTMASLSGGERIKVQMARLLMACPTLLLLDEPSNDLDMETLVWLERFMQRSSLPVLYISHDETLLARTADVILHMELIRRKTKPRYAVARMGYEAYVQDRLHKMERQEQQAGNERRELHRQQERYQRIYQKVERQQNTISRQDPFGAQRLKQKMHTVLAMGKRMEKAASELTEFPEAEDSIFFRLPKEHPLPVGKVILDVSLPVLQAGERVLAKDIQLRIQGPEKVGIIGKNGVGKTTLLKELLRRLREKENLTVQYMPQQYEELLAEAKTPVEFLAPSGSKEERGRVSTYLGSMKFTREEMFHPIGELSGGQKAKLLLLRLSLEQADVLVLDEPTRNFSPLSNPMIRSMLREYPGAIISISHDRKYLQEVCGKVYELSKEGLRTVEHI